MPKETETEDTIVFCHIFMIGGISVGGGPGPLATSINGRLFRGFGGEISFSRKICSLF